jgi:hypothetical protein
MKIFKILAARSEEQILRGELHRQFVLAQRRAFLQNTLVASFHASGPNSNTSYNKNTKS